MKKYNGTAWVDTTLRQYKTATADIEPTIYTDGTAITSYTLKGNTVQNGTPTSSNPVDVNGVGERTENLLSTEEAKEGYYIDQSGIERQSYYQDYEFSHTQTIPVQPNTEYTYSLVVSQTDVYRRIIAYDSSKNFLSQISDLLITNIGYKSYSFTTPTNCHYITINYVDDRYNNGDKNLMLNSGSTAKPYEPYGYKIPISTGQQTTNIYLGSTQTTRRIGKIDLSEVSWTKLTSGLWRTTDIPNIKYVSANTELGGGIAEKYTIHTGAGMISALNCIAIDVSQVSVNTGSDTEKPTGMFWYVLATPTTGIVNEPLMKIGDYADTLSNAASIPTTEGANSISVDTTVQPSEFTATWTGWHDASVKAKSENLLNPSDILYDTQFDSSLNPPAFVHNSMLNCSNYIPVTTDTYLRMLNNVAVGNWYYEFDANKNYLRTKSPGEGEPMVISNDASYIVFNFSKTVDINKYMFARTSTPLPYEPYWK